MGDYNQEGFYEDLADYTQGDFSQPYPKEPDQPEYCGEQDSMVSYVQNSEPVGSNSSLSSSSRKSESGVVAKKTTEIRNSDKLAKKSSLSTHFDKTRKRFYAFDHKTRRSYWL